MGRLANSPAEALVVMGHWTCIVRALPEHAGRQRTAQHLLALHVRSQLSSTSAAKLSHHASSWLLVHARSQALCPAGSHNPAQPRYRTAHKRARMQPLRSTLPGAAKHRCRLMHERAAGV
jgi:hypothetical protein